MLEIFKAVSGKNPLTRQANAKSYQSYPSVSEKLPWMDFDEQHQCFYLEDGRSVAAIFELADVPAEARPISYLQQLQQGLQGIFQDALPQYFDEESPWIVQFYIQDELSLKSFYHCYENYIKPFIRDTVYTQAYLKLFKEHLDFMTRPEGMFIDTKVSGTVFRGKIRKVRAVIYRRLKGLSKIRRGRDAIQDLNIVAHTFIAKLESCGVKVKRYSGKDFYEWMVKWFNPAPKQGDGNIDKLLEHCPYPTTDQRPWGYDFSEQLFYSVPESDHTKGVWYFDEKPHKYLTILGLNALPQTGHLTLERQFGNHFYSLFDKFPEGSVFQMTAVIQSQEAVKNHLFRIEKSASRSTSTESELAREDCAKAKRAIEQGNYFFPTVMGIYLRGNDLTDLYDKETEVETLLSSNGLHTLSGDVELAPIDSYLHYLPMCYSYEFDKNRTLRSRYLSGMQLSQLLPLYGRERGTGNPAITFYNRVGEPLTFDPLNPIDKDFNSHMVILGTTGSGKSATCVSLLMQMMAAHRPRIVIIDVGNSYKLLGDYFQSLGLSVNRVEISFNYPTSLNPFADSSKMLAQLRAKGDHPLRDIFEAEEKILAKELEALNQEAQPDEREVQENRDYLGEMMLAAQLMITGGEPKEEEAITREDRFWILKAVVTAARSAEKGGHDQMIANDLIKAFQLLAEELEKTNKRLEAYLVKRLRQMAANLSLFCQDNLSSQYFNTPGQPWPDADVTILEMGLFKEEGYDAQRALAYLGALNKTLSLVEYHQYEERPTLLIKDEPHVYMRYKPIMLAAVKGIKTSRKYGLWYWIATQNVGDFPDEARKMLSMMEYWVCMGMSEAELAEIERFRPFTEEERCFFRTVRKEAKKYVEGVILCNKFKGLFRAVPPRPCLALAMTEKHEKAERKAIMQQHNCTEVEAALLMAKRCC